MAFSLETILLWMDTGQPNGEDRFFLFYPPAWRNLGAYVEYPLNKRRTFVNDIREPFSHATINTNAVHTLLPNQPFIQEVMSLLNSILGNVKTMLEKENVSLDPQSLSQTLSKIDLGQAQNLVMQAIGAAFNTPGGISSLDQAKQKVFEAITSAAADGDISAMEMAEINGMQKVLGFGRREMTEVKVRVLEELANRASADGSVTAQELALLDEIEKDLDLTPEQSGPVRAKLERLRNAGAG